MAKSDVLVRMKADVSNYDANIAKARKNLQGFKQDNLTLGGILNQTTKSLTAAAAGFMSLAAAGAAIKGVIDESVQLAQAGEGIRIAFEKLNNPALLDDLRQATHNTVTDIELMKAAVKFNDFKLPVDQLGTMLAFAQQKAKDTGQSIDYMVDSIVTGLGRKSLMILDNLGLSAAEIKEKMKDTGDMTKAVGEIIREQMAKSGEYIETAADKAAQADTKLKNSMEALGETFLPLATAGAAMWNDLKVGAIDLLNSAIKPLIQAFTELGAIQKIEQNMNGGGMMDRFANNLRNSKDQKSLYSRQLMEINRSINKARANLQEAEKGGMGSIQIYKNRLQALENIKTQYESVAQSIMNPASPTSPTASTTTKTGGSKKNQPSIGDFDKALAKSLTGSTDLKETKEMMSPFAMMTEEAKKQMLGLSKSTRDWGGAMADVATQDIINQIDAITTRTEQQRKAFDMAAQSAANLGNALASIDDPAAKAVGTVMSAIANIALSFSQAAVQASSMGAYGWIAYMAAGLGTLATAISTVHSLTGYANGGEIKGNSYSGDNAIIAANAGEIVLNKSQQATLAGELQQNNGTSRIVGVLKGEDIVLMADRWGMRTGRGELLFGKNL